MACVRRFPPPCLPFAPHLLVSMLANLSSQKQMETLGATQSGAGPRKWIQSFMCLGGRSSMLIAWLESMLESTVLD